MTATEDTITITLLVGHTKILHKLVSWGHFNPQEELKTMLMQNPEVTNKEYYGKLLVFFKRS